MDEEEAEAEAAAMHDALEHVLGLLLLGEVKAATPEEDGLWKARKTAKYTDLGNILYK